MRAVMFRIISRYNENIKNTRQLKTVDIVKRIGVITPNRVHLVNYPITRPVTAFNPSIIINNEEVTLYTRIILGYFTYASAIAQIKFPLAEIDNISEGYFNAEIILYPDNKYDIWGVEDPRAYKLNDNIYITYCGRTVNYFNPAIRRERTLPVTAIQTDEGKWRKICVFKLIEGLRRHLVSDKDAFLVKMKELYLFHRLHTDDEMFYLTISKVDEKEIKDGEFREVIVKDTSIAFEQSAFEEKIGWGTPPIKIDKEYLLFLHGVDVEFQCYRVFAILMDDKLNVVAVTPYYIMEPKENYERYGDRPYTVFPCGAALCDDKIIVSYGASDSAIGLAEVKVDEIMSILDSNRFE